MDIVSLPIRPRDGSQHHMSWALIVLTMLALAGCTDDSSDNDASTEDSGPNSGSRNDSGAVGGSNESRDAASPSDVRVDSGHAEALADAAASHDGSVPPNQTSSDGGDASLPANDSGTLSDGANDQSMSGTCTAACGGGGPIASMDGYPAWYFNLSVMPEDRYTEEPETVHDWLTGLEWQRAVDATERSFADATSYCEELVIGAADDFRVPTRIELASLVFFSSSAPKISTTRFPDTPSELFWTSSPFNANGKDERWAVNFGGGQVNNGGLEGPFFVRCVREAGRCCDASVEPTTGAFVANGDGTVTDTRTQLVWEQQADDVLWSRDSATGYCGGLELGGRSDWRVPSVLELLSIVAESNTTPSIDEAAFPGTGPVEYRTSTEGENPNSSWIVNFSAGSCGTRSYADQFRVRCVHH